MRIPTSKFTHNVQEKTFTADASDLPHGWINGITLVSPRNTTAHFFFAYREDDGNEGDVKFWVFTCKTNAKVDGYRMVIFND